MANEAILIKETEIAIPINVDESVGIEKGTVLKLTANMTGAASSAADEAFGGITKIEKIANDGNTQVASYFGGVFLMVVGGGGATVGFNAVLAGANTVEDLDTLDIEEGLVIGKFLSTATSGQTVKVFVGKI